MFVHDGEDGSEWSFSLDVEEPPFSDFGEAVLKGHPDKVADVIADSVVDLCVSNDPDAKVAVDVVVKNNIVCFFGEVTISNALTLDEICNEAKNVGLKLCGYNSEEFKVGLIEISEQSTEIARYVTGKDKGFKYAGDQGVIYGMALNGNPDMIPFSQYYANKIARSLNTPGLDGIGPDGKVFVHMREDGIDFISVSVCHNPDYSVKTVEEIVYTHIYNAIQYESKTTDIKIEVNPPDGLFINGGFKFDTGVTGRKIISSSYGPMLPHGGGAMSGKDISKVDRFAALYARFIAKNIILEYPEFVQHAVVALGYTMGAPKAKLFNCFAEGILPYTHSELEEHVKARFPLDINKGQRLLFGHEPFINFRHATLFGTFGFSMNFMPWERKID